MLDNPPVLDSFFIDAVAEVLNIAMGNAAASLSEMISEEVQLSVPGVDFVSRTDAAQIIGEKAKTNVSGVLQPFHGAFAGEAMLLFPEKQSLDLVRAVLQQNDMTLDELTDLEQEAMTEIGNVILNACLCGIADMFSKEMFGQIPEYIQGSLTQVFAIDNKVEHSDAIVMLLNMDFSIENKKIQGYVTFLMDVDSVTQFKENIEKYIGAEV